MDNITRLDIVQIELNSGNLHRSWLNHSIGSGDIQANAFGVDVFRDGEPVSLSGGSVQGYFRDPRGNNIAITTGNTISGNRAYVVLPQACYNYDGQFTLAIKVIGGGVTGTMRIVDGIVDNTNTGSAVAPTETVPTYQEVLAVYDQMVAAKEGSVRFDTTQSLTTVQKTTARGNIDAASTDDVSSLMSAILQLETVDIQVESGTWNNSLEKTVNNRRIRSTSFISRDTIKSITIPSGYDAMFMNIDKTGNRISNTAWKTGTVVMDDILHSTARSFVIIIEKSDATTSDISSYVSTVQSGISAKTIYAQDENDFSRLQAAFVGSNVPEMELGAYNSDGTKLDRSDRLRTVRMLNGDGGIVTIKTGSGYLHCLAKYNADGTWDELTDFTSDEMVYTGLHLFKVCVTESNSATLTPTTNTGLKIYGINKESVDRIESEIETLDNEVDPYLDKIMGFRIGTYSPSSSSEFSYNGANTRRCCAKFMITDPCEVVVRNKNHDYTYMVYAQNPSTYEYTTSAWKGDSDRFSLDDTTKLYYVIVQKENAVISSEVDKIKKSIILRQKTNIIDICFPHYENGLMSCFGDSYTAMSRWQPTVAKDLLLSEYENTAISGGNLTGGFADISNVDADSAIITVWYGTNDYANSRLLGDVSTPVAVPGTTATDVYFWGALKYVCEWLGANRKNARVLFITHTQRWSTEADQTFLINNGTNARGFIKNDRGYSLEDYTNAVVECANLYGYDVLDLFHMSGVNKYNGDAFYESDMLHPTWAAGELFGHMIAEKLRTMN